MNIYIPTKGRLNKQITFCQLSSKLREQVYFVVCSKEEDDFVTLVGASRCIVCDLPGVAAARQAAVMHAINSGQRYIMFLDDDLKFAMRVDADDTTLTGISGVQLEDVFAMVEAKFAEPYIEETVLGTTKYPIGIIGIDARGGNNNRKVEEGEEWIYNTRQMRAFAIDCDLLVKHHIMFDKYLYWEDFHVTLCFLKHKIANAMSIIYTQNASTNSAGGCSLYRKIDTLRSVREEFLAEHSPYAVPVDKPSESWGGDLGNIGTVPDLRIAWKKAFNHGDE